MTNNSVFKYNYAFDLKGERLKCFAWLAYMTVCTWMLMVQAQTCVTCFVKVQINSK